MAVLTYNEGEIITIIRRHARQGDPVSNATIRRDALNHHHRISYDATNRALAGLIDKGVAIKPSRGFYLPAEDS